MSGLPSATNMARSKQGSVDMPNNRASSSIYQMAQNAASLNSTQLSNFASMAGKENQH